MFGCYAIPMYATRVCIRYAEGSSLHVIDETREIEVRENFLRFTDVAGFEHTISGVPFNLMRWTKEQP